MTLSYPSDWRVTLDFDGTVTRADTVDAIHEAFALPIWRDVEALWEAGEIGSFDCMTRQAALLRVAPAELDAFLDRVEVDWGLPGLLRACARAGAPVAVVSDGYDRAARRVLARMGAARLPIYANRLQPGAGDRWRLSSPHRAEGCAAGTCKCALAAAAAQPLTVLIGDGRSDRCLARRADLVFAKPALADWCRHKRIAHIAIRGLDDVTPHLADLDAARALAQTSLRTPEHAR